MSNVSTDPIADMLSRIRNAVAVQKHAISMPHSNVKEAVAKILKQTNFIDDVSVAKAEVGKTMHITINQEGTNARITELTRLSRPGRRQYVGTEDIPTIKQGRGLVVISTSKGIMTGADAKKKGIGGELICKIY